ncbi:MAG TPA: DUF58 domain-containing protein [Steroidobacteraceae bacterium]|jgi:uncharacterized protein (DUF58 family)|nr:DUF58 domain-containing protein [Steroidobacteraceae bacterium]
MPASARTPEALLRRLEWTVLRRLDGLLQGDYRSLFRGSGIDLANLREYQEGDDVRYIDWNVTARLQTPHVREYLEDRELTAWFLLDLSPSVDFGSDAVSKRMVLAEFVAVMARLLTGKGNYCGALLFSGGVDRVVPPRGGRRQVLHLLDLLAARPRLVRAPATDLGAILRQAANVIRRHSMVFVVSDFISKAGWERALGLLARRHEVVAIRLFDPSETRIPDIGLLAFEDAETGEQMFFDTNDAGLRRRFTAAAQRQQDTLRATFAKAGVDCLELSTEDDLLDAVVRFAQMRKQHHKSGSGGTLPDAALEPASAPEVA